LRSLVGGRRPLRRPSTARAWLSRPGALLPPRSWRALRAPEPLPLAGQASQRCEECARPARGQCRGVQVNCPTTWHRGHARHHLRSPEAASGHPVAMFATQALPGAFTDDELLSKWLERKVYILAHMAVTARQEAPT